MRKWFDKIKAFFEKLEKRERLFVLVGIISFVIFLSIILLSIFSGSGEKRKNKLELAQAEQEKFIQMLKEYNSLEKVVKRVDERVMGSPKGFDLFSEVNRIALANGVRDRIQKMDPNQGPKNDFYSEQYVDINLKDVDFVQLIQFLLELEKLPGMVRISQLNLKKPRSGAKQLDISVRVSAYVPVSGE